MSSRVLLLALATLAGFAHVPAMLNAQVTNGSPGEPLYLRPGDALRFEMRDEPALTGDYAVDVEGLALLPMIGLVEVASRPFDDVRRDVLAAFARELADPAGRIRVTPVLRIAVLGEVSRPGLMGVDPTLTLTEVIANAGGLTPSADRSAISLMREGRPVLTTSIDELALARTPIRSGDQVVVGRRSWLQENAPIVIGGGVSVLVTLITAVLLR